GGGGAQGLLPARAGLCGGGGTQVLVHQGDGGGAFADGGGDPFDRSAAHVPGGEHPGQAGLQWQRPAGGVPAGAAGAGGQVGAGADVPPLVAGDGLVEPLGARPGADEDEQGVGGGGAARPPRGGGPEPAVAG